MRTSKSSTPHMRPAPFPVRRQAWLLFLPLLLTLPAQAQTFSVLHAFTGGNDGANPYAGLTLDQSGNLYGTTTSGGLGSGEVFRLTQRNSSWIVQTLYAFQGTTRNHDGANPTARISLRSGVVYGTTLSGGLTGCSNNAGCGTVFRLRPPITFCGTFACPWNETILYRFSGGSDGGNPVGDLLFDQSGNLYGATSGGGSSNCNYQPGSPCGVVYTITAAGSQSAVYQMPGSPGGSYPEAGLAFDHANNLLGTSSAGGSANLGTVFKLTPTQGGWSASSIYNFQSGGGGASPWAGLVADASGNFYGATTSAGSNNSGTIYQLSPSGSGWSYTTIYSFAPNTGGAISTLAIDSAGALYGTSPSGGSFGHGSVFKLTHFSGGWTYTSLHDFSGGSDGSQPVGGVIVDGVGNIYGTAFAGGGGSCSTGCGVVWEVAQGLTITTSTLPNGNVGQSYQAQLGASGGQPPYSWAITSGSLPPGLSMGTSGLISGDPTTPGTYPFTVQVTDQLSNRASKNLSITIASGLSITTTQLPNGTQGVPYSSRLSASGGVLPYTWSIVSGSLPAGLHLSASDGSIQGTPSAPGLSSFTVQVQDASLNVAQAGLQISVAPAVTNGTLSGHFAVILHGFRNGSPFILVGAISADGNGNITAGRLDVNYGQGEPNDTTYCFGNPHCPVAETVQSPGSVYDLTAANGLGTLTLSTLDYYGNPHTYRFSIAVSAGGCRPAPSLSACGQLIERDSTNPQTYGSGVLKVQDAAYFSSGAFFPGNFAVLAAGEDPAGRRYGAVGALATNPGTGVDIDCRGNGWNLPYCPLDYNDGGNVGSDTFNGSFSADVDPNTGRGNFANISFPGDPSGYCTGTGGVHGCGYAYYVINRNEMVLISADSLSTPANLAIWTLSRQPSGAQWSVSSLRGVSVAGLTGTSANNADVMAGLFTANGSGSASFSSDENSAGTLTRQTSSGTYSVDAIGAETGKVALTGFSQLGSGGAEIYLYSQNTGYVLAMNSDVSVGEIGPQTGAPYSTNSMTGQIVGGTLWPAATGVTNSSTSLFADGSGNIAATQYTSGAGGPGGPINLSLTYQVDSTGRAVVLQNGSPFGILYIIGLEKMVLVPSGGFPTINVFIAGQPY